MINLAGRDILHSWGKFAFTGIGLGLLIGATLTMAGVYRGMVDDARALLDNSGADLWVVQQDTLGPYAESSSVHDDVWRSIAGMEGVARAANITYLTMQVRQIGPGARDVRAMVVGVAPDGPGYPGQPVHLLAHLRPLSAVHMADPVRGRQADAQHVGRRPLPQLLAVQQIFGGLQRRLHAAAGRHAGRQAPEQLSQVLGGAFWHGSFFTHEPR